MIGHHFRASFNQNPRAAVKTFRQIKGIAGLVVALAFAAPASSVMATQSDPAAARIEAFDQALIDTLKDGPALGAKGRFRKLTPVVQEAFDLPLMTQFAVGPAWATMSDADHQALIAGFARLSTASYAHNFDKFSGQKFEIDPNVTTRGSDKIVQSRLISGSRTVQLIYRMRQAGGTWKIVDVYYDSISQLTTRRSDFHEPLASGGAKGLLAHLNSTAEKLLQ